VPSSAVGHTCQQYGGRSVLGLGTLGQFDYEFKSLLGRGYTSASFPV